MAPCLLVVMLGMVPPECVNQPRRYPDALPFAKLPHHVDLHRGSTIYVVASGSSIDHIAPTFFEGALTIGVNRVNMYIRPTYLVSKEGLKYETFQSWSAEREATSTTYFVARGDKGECKDWSNADRLLMWCLSEREWCERHIVVYDHPCHTQRCNRSTVQSLPPAVLAHQQLLVSSSTVTTAIHLAAVMGAARVLVVGHDGGLVDGKANFEGYHTPATMAISHGASSLSAMRYRSWLFREKLSENGDHINIINDTVALRTLLLSRYPRLHGIHTISPFIGMGLEGHHFQDSAPTALAHPPPPRPVPRAGSRPHMRRLPIGLLRRPPGNRHTQSCAGRIDRTRGGLSLPASPAATMIIVVLNLSFRNRSWHPGQAANSYIQMVALRALFHPLSGYAWSTDTVCDAARSRFSTTDAENLANRTNAILDCGVGGPSIEGPSSCAEADMRPRAPLAHKPRSLEAAWDDSVLTVAHPEGTLHWRCGANGGQAADERPLQKVISLLYMMQKAKARGQATWVMNAMFHACHDAFSQLAARASLQHVQQMHRAVSTEPLSHFAAHVSRGTALCAS